ncbi:uncharacterized protein FOMMEDRAFT_142822 [Fomitiporia mediterranea MF3/22]|uniref:uncharacterized protein n=1 Tax=Fomitiporia mediterranea (strain MF3/22) TaxID=694068 RepID=UPI00044096BE|nr:uncharacterized protein FOMMEDRAFT_142822 [Fomitiporia mediterranea MF3/22]EJC99203.1 hypothetical protein FOMMEDRAFT_142822 [Fomitiporia mediterranea MF3/22]
MKGRARPPNKVGEAESELPFSFDVIAASAFHGNQSLKPSIHFAKTPTTSRTHTATGTGTNTTSTGLNTTSTHSRNTSNASRGAGSGTSRSNGHARKESWSKAIKSAKHTANATGLCAFNEDLSPADEKVIALDNRLQQDRTRYVHGGSHDSPNDPGESDVVLITAQASKRLDASQQNANGLNLSPVPSNRSGDSTGNSGVGIALSTPTVLIEQPFQFADHPYANGTRQSEDMPRPAEYAGPHPSRMADFAMNETALSDVSVRHRMPMAASRPRSDSPPPVHPYATADARSRPTLKVPLQSIPPPKKMFADVGTGSIREVMPEEIQYSPYSAQYSAASSKRNSELGVEEALSVAFRRGRTGGAQAEEQVSSGVDETSETEDFGSGSGVQELIVPPIFREGSPHRGDVTPRADDNSVRDAWQNSQDEDNVGNLVVPTPMSAASYKLNSSPAQMSLDSSPMASPRQFKRFDDMEDYSDLFYRPGQQSTVAGSARGSSGEPTPPGELVRTLSSGGESSSPQRPMLARSNSALTNLRRQLSEEYGSNSDDRQVLSGDLSLHRHGHVSDVLEVDEGDDELHAVLSQGSSPPGASLPLRLQTAHAESPGPEGAIPEDVESSRASSILERFETEDGTEIYYHLGEVPTLTTPDPVTASNVHRASAHGSYIENTPRSELQLLSPIESIAPDRPSRPSLLPPKSATTSSTTRGSYSTSSASHMSQLSEFPAPPGTTSLTPGTIIQSYFGNTPEATERGDPLAGSESPLERKHLHQQQSQQQQQEVRRSRRTTFGPVPDDDESD